MKPRSKRQDWIMAQAVAEHVREVVPVALVEVKQESRDSTIAVRTPAGGVLVCVGRVRKDDPTGLRLADGANGPYIDLADPGSLEQFVHAVWEAVLGRLERTAAQLKDATDQLNRDEAEWERYERTDEYEFGRYRDITEVFCGEPDFRHDPELDYHYLHEPDPEDV